MVACFRQGYVVLPCNEQLRAQGPAPAPRRSARRRSSSATSATRTCSRRPAGTGRRSSSRAATSRRSALEPPPAADLAPLDPLPDHVHERHRGRAEGRRARPALPRRPGAAGRALARAAARRPRLVHGRQRLEQVGAQRLRRALDPRRGGAAARRALRSRTSAWSCSSASASNVLCMAPTEYRVIAKRATLRPLAGAARARRRRRGAEPRGAARLAGGDGPCRSATATARPRPAS